MTFLVRARLTLAIYPGTCAALLSPGALPTPGSTVSTAIYHPKEFPHLAVVRGAGSSADNIRNTALSSMNPQKWGARGNTPGWSQAAAGQRRRLISGILWQSNNGTEIRSDSTGPNAKRIKKAPRLETKAPQVSPGRRVGRLPSRAFPHRSPRLGGPQTRRVRGGGGSVHAGAASAPTPHVLTRKNQNEHPGTRGAAASAGELGFLKWSSEVRVLRLGHGTSATASSQRATELEPMREIQVFFCSSLVQ